MNTHDIKKIEDIIASKLKHIGYYRVEVDEDKSLPLLWADGMLRKILVYIIVENAVKRAKINNEELKPYIEKAKTNHREFWTATLKTNQDNYVEWKMYAG